MVPCDQATTSIAREYRALARVSAVVRAIPFPPDDWREASLSPAHGRPAKARGRCRGRTGGSPAAVGSLRLRRRCRVSALSEQLRDRFLDIGNADRFAQVRFATARERRFMFGCTAISGVVENGDVWMHLAQLL